MLQFHENGSLTPMASADPVQVKSLRADGRKPSVLLVEDDVILAIDLELSFEDAGFRVIGPAATEAEALELIEAHKPDFAALDWNLRTGTSAGVAAALARIGTRFVFVTAMGSHVSYDGPRAEILSKPADPRRVMQALAA